MNVVFFHDHVFLRKDDKYYSEGKLTDSTWERYTKFCDKLIVVCRYKDMGSLQLNLNPTTDPKVEFDCLKPWSKRDVFLSSNIKNKIVENLEISDVVVCRVPSVLGFLSFDIARSMGKKVICEVVGCPLDSYANYGTYLSKFISPFMYLKMKSVLRKSTYSIYVSNFFLQERYPTKGVYCSASNVSLNRHTYRISRKNNTKRIMFIGSLNARYKGLEDLIRASHLTMQNNHDIELHILGSGDKTRYEEIIFRLNLEGKVYFYDPLPGGDAVLEWLSTGDIYVQPSHTEGLPRSLIEAMSVGLPCIGTKVGGIPELLDPRCLVSPKCPIELSRAINDMIDNSVFRDEQSHVNLRKSHNYHLDLLNEKRDKFLRKYIF